MAVLRLDIFRGTTYNKNNNNVSRSIIVCNSFLNFITTRISVVIIYNNNNLNKIKNVV